MGDLLFQIDGVPPQCQALRQAHAGEKHEFEESRVNLAGPVRVVVKPGDDHVRFLQGERVDLFLGLLGQLQ
ncbi:hypothetical protein D3C84_1207440 [compost metagenome]